jgi:hypothetical protein
MCPVFRLPVVLQYYEPYVHLALEEANLDLTVRFRPHSELENPDQNGFKSKLTSDDFSLPPYILTPHVIRSPFVELEKT